MKRCKSLWKILSYNFDIQRLWLFGFKNKIKPLYEWRNFPECLFKFLRSVTYLLTSWLAAISLPELGISFWRESLLFELHKFWKHHLRIRIVDPAWKILHIARERHGITKWLTCGIVWYDPLLYAPIQRERLWHRLLIL